MTCFPIVTRLLAATIVVLPCACGTSAGSTSDGENATNVDASLFRDAGDTSIPDSDLHVDATANGADAVGISDAQAGEDAQFDAAMGSADGGPPSPISIGITPSPASV